jgi:hypothetical protein
MNENNLSHTPGNIFNIDENRIQITNQTMKYKKAYDSIWRKTVKMSVLASFKAAGQFLPPVLIFTSVDIRHEFGDGLPPSVRLFTN